MFKTITYKLLVIVWSGISVPVITYKIYNDNGEHKIVFANYNGYMSPTVISSNSDSIQFESFGSDKQVLENFQNQVYDAAIVSNSTGEELIKSQMLKPIDWSKLNLKNESNKAISSHSDAAELYSEETKKILDNNKEQLQYGIPYFLSYLSFFYRGTKIDTLEEKKSWKEITEIIANEKRFQSSNRKPAISIIDDARTIYSMSQLLNDDNADINKVSTKLKDVKKIYNKWSALGFNKEKLGKIFLNSNSASLIDMLSSKDIMGSFFYNGDALFSLQGGNVKTTIPKDDFHTVNPTSLIYFLDSLVISKTITPEKENKLYEFIKQTFFGGMNETDEAGGMFRKNDQNEYMYDSAKNFDFVFYTPTLKKLIKSLEENDKLFSDDEDTYKDLKKKMLLLNTTQNEITIPEDNQIKILSNTNIDTNEIQESVDHNEFIVTKIVHFVDRADQTQANTIPQITKTKITPKTQGPRIIYESYIDKTTTTNLNLAYEDWKSNY